MAQVETVAEKIEAEKRKAMILAFLGALLFFVPIAGQVLGSVVSLAEVGTIVTMVGVAGDVAMGVYTIVDDPKNAPLGIISLVLAPLSLANLPIISRAASIRRGMSDADVVKLGGRIGNRMATIRKITGVCRKAF